MSISRQILEMGAWASGRLNKGEVDEITKKLDPLLKSASSSYQLAGSYRRKSKDIGDIDYILVRGKLKDIEKDISNYFSIVSVPRSGDKMLTVIVDHKGKEVQIEFSDIDGNAMGAALLHSTGSGDFNMGLRAHAKKKGYLLNQYGLFDKSGKKVAGKTEKEIFNALGLDEIPPTERKDFWAIKNKYLIKKQASFETNAKVAEKLRAIAKKLSGFKAVAFRKAANAIEDLQQDIEQIPDPTSIENVGKGVAVEIQHILASTVSPRMKELGIEEDENILIMRNVGKLI